ncbi:MAG: DUF3077 domain-containing protein [Pseudomonas sp.]|uniref:DUF6124 family protein n=1 Tax=Pseudomonas sp. TaxID=306 RepID=UPI003C73F6C0
MKKITPDATDQVKANSDDEPRKIFHVGADVGTEEALANASEILSSALQIAYRCAEDPGSTRSPVIMGLAQLIENAQSLMDAVLERNFPVETPRQ